MSTPICVIVGVGEGNGAALARAFSGVNLIPAATDSELLERQLHMCIDLAVPVVALFWELVPGVLGRLRDAGILVVYQVGSAKEA
jgi:nitronate monooxygenase